MELRDQKSKWFVRHRPYWSLCLLETLPLWLRLFVWIPLLMLQGLQQLIDVDVVSPRDSTYFGT